MVDHCTHLFIGSLSCDVSKWFNSGTEEKYTATLLEQPFAPDNCTFGLALDSEGSVYLAGTTGFPGTDFPMIEKFDFDLTSGSLWKDLSTLSFTYAGYPIYGFPAGTYYIEPLGCFGAIAMVFDGEDNLWLLTGTRTASLASGPLVLWKITPTTTTRFILEDKTFLPGAPILSSPTQTPSMDITSTGILIIAATNGISWLVTFDTRTGRQGDNIDPVETTGGNAYSFGDIAVFPTDNNIYAVLSTSPDSLDNRSIIRLTLGGTVVRTYTLPTVTTTFRRVISRSPDNLTLWASSSVTSFATDMPPYVWLIDIETGAITRGGNLTTNFGNEAIFNMAVCRKNIAPRLRVSTVVGAT